MRNILPCTAIPIYGAGVLYAIPLRTITERRKEFTKNKEIFAGAYTHSVLSPAWSDEAITSSDS